jgi:hypothetical protein
LTFDIQPLEIENSTDWDFLSLFIFTYKTFLNYMAKLTLKVKKIAFKHPQTKKAGFVARVVTNGTETFDDICEIAGMNTTYAQEEIVACAGLMLKAAARQLKNGKIIDLGPLGKLYPSVSGKWVEKEDDLALTDLTPHCNYRPSQEIAEAISGASIGWATAKDESKDGTEQEPETPVNNGDNQGGGNVELEG